MSVQSVELSAAARQDLARLWQSRATYSSASADELILNLDAAFQMLRQLPSAGRTREELGEGIRTFVRGKYVIIYTVEDVVLRVIRVVNAREDWDPSI